MCPCDGVPLDLVFLKVKCEDVGLSLVDYWIAKIDREINVVHFCGFGDFFAVQNLCA